MRKILIVDDSASNRRLLIAIIKKNNWVWLEAEDGKKGLEIAQKQHPDIIITDVEMPEMNGIDFIKSLRKDPKLCNIPVIFYTGASYVPDASMLCLSYGVPMILVKPCKPDVVEEAITNVMKHIENKDSIPPEKSPHEITLVGSDLPHIRDAITEMIRNSDQVTKNAAKLKVLLKVLYSPEGSEEETKEEEETET